MVNSYSIPAEQITIEIEVRKSRFICHLAHASNPAEAKQFIAKIARQYADATHNCWAFQTEEPDSLRSIGCSDDGEPHGTAGKPMLNVICHSNIGEIVAVVTRFYGGTKLGSGGLVRAYSESVKRALDKLKICEKKDWKFANLSLDYALQSSVEKIFQETGAEIISSRFADKVTFGFRYDVDSLDEIKSRLANQSQGKLKIYI